MSVKNFVQCGLDTPVAANTTELALMAPTASYQYPPLDGGTLVIADSVARPSFYEIISYTHRIENVLYGVVRAKEGTTARAWSGVTWIYQALTAQDYVDALALKAALDSPALTGTPTAPTAALGVNTNQIATMAALKAAIDNLVGGAPGALDALNELAAALGNDPNFATTMTNALAGKEPSIAAGTSAQMWLGNKTWASVMSQVQGTLLTGLGVGANTPIVSTDTLIGALAKIQNQLNNKAAFTDSRLSNAREWTATEVSQSEAQAGTATVPRKWTALRVWQAVLASSLTGLNLTVGTAVAASDTVLVAIGKLQKQITDAASNLAGSVRATVLTGYVSGSNVVLASTDTVLAAFGKLQAQITGLATSKLDATANAVSASKLQTACTINGVPFDGTANITVADSTKLPLAGGNMTGDLSIIKDNPWLSLDSNSTGGDGVEQGAGISIGESGKKGNDALHLTYTGDGYGHIGMGTVDPTSGIPAYRAMSFYYQNANVTFHGTISGNGSGLTNLDANQLASGTIPDARLSGTYTGVNIIGNAATATKLATARTINGVAFDGSANITVADATKMPLDGGTFTGTVHTKDAGINSNSAGGSNAFHVMGSPSSGAVFSLHRANSFAINIGLDTDDVFRIGGWSDGNTHRMHLDRSGNFTARGNVTAYSDIRLKTDIQVIPDALAKVCALRGVTYERLDSGERQTGVIAQEVEAVLPEAVQDTGDYLSVAYGNLVGLLIEAIKELKAEVEELKLKVDA